MSQANDFGDELVLRGAAAADAPRLRSRAVDRLDAVAAVRSRHRDQPIRAKRGEENLEIFAARQWPVGYHRHLAIDAAVDNKRPPSNPCRVLNEGPDVGITNVERILSLNRGRGHQSGGKHQGKFQAHNFLGL